MTKEQHTPTPAGLAEDSAEGGRMIALGDNDDYAVAVGPNQEQFAAFIVRAVNNHQALVEALEATQVYLGDDATDDSPEARATRDVIRKALEQAKC